MSIQQLNSKPKVLVIAEAANPEWPSVPLVGWSHYLALSKVADVHLATQIRNRDALLRAGLTEGKEFTCIDTEPMAAPLYKFATLLRGGTDKAWTIDTAIAAISYYFFEHLVWKRFFADRSHYDFNLVHRITPLSPTTPSIIAKKLHAISIPFVVGPLNGGVPWPKEFQAAQHKEKEWLSYIRDAYKLMPGFRATREYASAILIGSRDTLKQQDQKYAAKTIYLPENGIDTTRFNKFHSDRNATIKAAFVGRLVPYKGCDMLLEAIAPLCIAGKLTLDVYGDGPERTHLTELANRLNLQNQVKFHGFVKNTELQNHLSQADIFTFPSIREFGGGVVLEAMALGVVPVIVDYAGPAELVTEATGFSVALGNRGEIIARLRETITRITENPAVLDEMKLAARERVNRLFTWEAKAQQSLQVYDWVLGNTNIKPDFGTPLR